MSQYYYYANPKIHFFPRGLNDLLDEEKKTVDGVETVERKCGLKDILRTYEDDRNYAFGNRHFKNIESRIYLDLWNDHKGNEYTVTKKVCIGFLSERDEQLRFVDKEACFYSLELTCEIPGSSQLTAYLKADGRDSSGDPGSPLVINMNPVESRIKELSVIIKYGDDAELPENAELNINAKFINTDKWKTFTLSLYRNPESSLDDFKQNPGKKDKDFFVLPRVAPSANQKKCIKQLQILNNQVFARNKSLENFTFVEESGEIIKTTGTAITKIYETMSKNAYNSLEAFKYDLKTGTGCKSGAKIGKIETQYSYNFINYGHQKGFIDYLANEYSLGPDTLKGIIYDRNFLYGNYKDGDPDSKIEGIVNLYKKVVVNFISNTLTEANKYVNFPCRWLSCPKFNPNYHRGDFTTVAANKNLYSSIDATTGMPGSVYTNLASISGYNGANNLLPAETTVRFVVGQDKYAYNIDESHCYQINEIKFPSQKDFTPITQPLWIQLSDEEKQTCDDTQFNENYCDYGLYTNNGVPYFISSDRYQGTSGWLYGGKHKYNDFLNMTNDGHNWYSYTHRPSMYDSVGIGLDCSGLVINCICDCNSFDALLITDEKRRDGINVTNLRDNLCRKIMGTQSEYISILQKSDVIMSTSSRGNHIVLCNQGDVKDAFANSHVSQSDMNTADVQVIHNYGATKLGEKNYIINNGTSNYNGCFMKTLSGPYKHTGIKLTVSDTNILSPNITLGRIYLWKKD